MTSLVELADEKRFAEVVKLDNSWIAEQEAERRAELICVCWAAKERKRSGDDAAFWEMVDRKWANKLCHCLETALRGWNRMAEEGKRISPSELVVVDRSVVDWSEFCEDHAAWVVDRMVLVSSYAVRSREGKFGNKCLRQYEWELEQLARIRKDMEEISTSRVSKLEQDPS